MNRIELLEQVADFYGLATQMRKTIEELQELTKAITEQKFDGEGGIFEETADVYNMLDQLCYLTDSKQIVQDIAQSKMERTVQRIKQSKQHEHILARFSTTI